MWLAKDNLSPFELSTSVWLAKDKWSPFELSTSVWLAKDLNLSPFELSTSVWLAKDKLSHFELSTSVWLAKDNLSPFELSTSVWLANDNFSPQYYAAIICIQALGSSTCMQIECVITYHAMNTASCHILYTPYISRGFYFREFRESGASREFNNTRKYLPPIRTHECDLCTPPRSRI